MNELNCNIVYRTCITSQIERSSRVACFHVRDDRSSLTCQKSVRDDRSSLTPDHPSRVTHASHVAGMCRAVTASHFRPATLEQDAGLEIMRCDSQDLRSILKAIDRDPLRFWLAGRPCARVYSFPRGRILSGIDGAATALAAGRGGGGAAARAG